MRIFFIIFLVLLSLSNLYAQSVVEQLTQATAPNQELPIFEERIVIIGKSRRIFILTNSNNALTKGDFISLILDDKLISRALVAKTEDGNAGIKNLKVYDLEGWKKLKQGLSIKVLRGDDSGFKVASKNESETDAGPKINDFDDLYNDVVIEDDLADLEKNKKRVIKTDNMIGVSYSPIYSVENVQGQTEEYSMWYAHWSYQFLDNVWGQFQFGRSTLQEFPGDNLETTVNKISVKAKYTIATPLYTITQPFIGVDYTDAKSPKAGECPTTASDSESETQCNTALYAAEAQAIDDINGIEIIFGVTLLKRLVPGWFFHLDIGNDLIGGGLDVEF